MKVEFIDVGRDKKRWIAEIETDEFGNLIYRSIIRSIKAHKALQSSDIDLDDDGNIYVGGFRPVGTFRVIEQAQAE